VLVNIDSTWYISSHVLLLYVEHGRNGVVDRVICVKVLKIGGATEAISAVCLRSSPKISSTWFGRPSITSLHLIIQWLVTWSANEEIQIRGVGRVGVEIRIWRGVVPISEELIVSQLRSSSNLLVYSLKSFSGHRAWSILLGVVHPRIYSITIPSSIRQVVP
jgi:hypothetical protein